MRSQMSSNITTVPVQQEGYSLQNSRLFEALPSSDRRLPYFFDPRRESDEEKTGGHTPIHASNNGVQTSDMQDFSNLFLASLQSGQLTEAQTLFQRFLDLQNVRNAPTNLAPLAPGSSEVTMRTQQTLQNPGGLFHLPNSAQINTVRNFQEPVNFDAYSALNLFQRLPQSSFLSQEGNNRITSENLTIRLLERMLSPSALPLQTESLVQSTPPPPSWSVNTLRQVLPPSIPDTNFSALSSLHSAFPSVLPPTASALLGMPSMVHAAHSPSHSIPDVYSNNPMLASLLSNPNLNGNNPSIASLLNTILESFGQRDEFVPGNDRTRSPDDISISLALPADINHLSEYQIAVRQQLEFFISKQSDVDSNIQGRKKRIRIAQVGIRCRHCAHLPLRHRGRGAVYYPTKLSGVYQASQNMATTHLSVSCSMMPEDLRRRLLELHNRRDTASGGKQYWADSCHVLGLYEEEDGIRLNPSVMTQTATPL
jgi:hypothetical protein